MMAFLSPLFLAGALAAAIPVILHLLKRRPEASVMFSAVRLLQRAPVEHAQKRRLRELLLLALRVTVLVLLALAFARPFLAAGAAGAPSGVTVVALDTSLSMSAPGQFEKARQLATQAIDGAPSGAWTAVVAFADRARVISEPSSDRTAARAAVDAVRPGVGSTSYQAGLNVAGDLLRGRPGTIVVVTDLQESGWDAGGSATAPESARVDVADVGAAPANLAVTAARATGDRVVATLRNTGSQTSNARVVLTVGSAADGALLPAVAAGEAMVAVDAGQTAEAVFTAPPGTWASVAVDDRGGIEADNVRYLVLGNRARPRVLIVTATGDSGRDAFYVEQALSAEGTGGGAYEADGVAGNDLQSWDQARLDTYAAVVLLSTRGLDHRGRALLSEYVRKGGGILVAAGAEVDGDVVSDVLAGVKVGILPPAGAGAVGRGASAPGGPGPRVLAPLDARHPVLRDFAGRSSLGLIRFQTVTTIRADDCQIVARFTTGEPALFDCEPGQGRALLFASDLNKAWNDFPLRATFLPFLREATRYLSGAQRTAEYLVGEVPTGVPAVPGVVPVAGVAGGAPRLAAVNVDPRESDPGRLTTKAFLAAVTRLKETPVAETHAEARQQEDRQQMWRYALALMVAALVAESLVATRAA